MPRVPSRHSRPHSGDALTARRSAQVRGAHLAPRVAPRARRVSVAALHPSGGPAAGGTLGGHSGAACQLVEWCPLLELERSHAEQAWQLSHVVEWLKKWQFANESQYAKQPSGVAV